MKQEYKIVIKKIPSKWERVKKGVYVFYIGETEADIGKRVVFPSRSSVGKVIGNEEIGKDYSVKVDSKSNKLLFGNNDKAVISASFKMKLTDTINNSKRWEVEIDQKHYDLLMKNSITSNEATAEIYSE